MNYSIKLFNQYYRSFLHFIFCFVFFFPPPPPPPPPPLHTHTHLVIVLFAPVLQFDFYVLFCCFFSRFFTLSSLSCDAITFFPCSVPFLLSLYISGLHYTLAVQRLDVLSQGPDPPPFDKRDTKRVKKILKDPTVHKVGSIVSKIHELIPLHLPKQRSQTF